MKEFPSIFYQLGPIQSESFRMTNAFNICAKQFFKFVPGPQMNSQ